MEARTYDNVSVEEYLRIEEASSVRHEYVGGVLYAMVGASRRHGRIVYNITTLLGPVAERERCEVQMLDIKLRVTANIIYYPDIMVICDPEDTDELMASKPCLVVEVLSPSTMSTDRREKLFAYQQLNSLQAYLLVAQDEPRVELWTRGADLRWSAAEFAGDATVTLPCPRMDLALTDIYRGVFPSPPDPNP